MQPTLASTLAQTITLALVNEDNIDALLDLTLKDGQEAFVASVAVSLAQAFVYKQAWPRAIVAGETVVGFLMLSIERSNRVRQSRRRFLFEPVLRCRGNGSQAYSQACGFTPTGELDEDGKVIMSMPL